MASYKQMYLTMFNAAADSLRLMEAAVETLKKAHIDCEEIYMRMEQAENILELPDCES